MLSHQSISISVGESIKGSHALHMHCLLYLTLIHSHVINGQQRNLITSHPISDQPRPLLPCFNLQCNLTKQPLYQTRPEQANPLLIPSYALPQFRIRIIIKETMPQSEPNQSKSNQTTVSCTKPPACLVNKPPPAKLEEQRYATARSSLKEGPARLRVRET